MHILIIAGNARSLIANRGDLITAMKNAGHKVTALVPVHDPEALAEAMRFFIDHPEQIASMGRASRQYAEDRYDVRKVNAIMLKEMGL